MNVLVGYIVSFDLLVFFVYLGFKLGVVFRG